MFGVGMTLPRKAAGTSGRAPAALSDDHHVHELVIHQIVHALVRRERFEGEAEWSDAAT